MKKPSREAKQRSVAASAFARLYMLHGEDDARDGADLFGDEWHDARGWAYKLVRRLVRDGVLHQVKHEGERRVRYMATANGRKLLGRATESPKVLSALLWPSEWTPDLGVPEANPFNPRRQHSGSMNAEANDDDLADKVLDAAGVERAPGRVVTRKRVQHVPKDGSQRFDRNIAYYMGQVDLTAFRGMAVRVADERHVDAIHRQIRRMVKSAAAMGGIPDLLERVKARKGKFDATDYAVGFSRNLGAALAPREQLRAAPPAKGNPFEVPPRPPPLPPPLPPRPPPRPPGDPGDPGDMAGLPGGEDEEFELQEALAGLLKLASATAENMIYLRERTDELHKAIAGVNERLDALEALWE